MMKYSKNRIKAILIKDSQDIWKSTNIVYMYLLPIVLTILWSRFIPDMPAGFALSFGLMFLVIMVGMYVPSMIIAEEKEKKTIEILLLSPAKPLEVFIGKGLITLISILITAVILLIISGNLQTQIYLILIATTLISTFSIFLGMIVGLLAENQMSTGVIGLPVYLILLLVPQFSMMGIRIMEDIGRFLPTYYYLDLLNIVTEGKEIRLISHFGVLLSSILVAFILLYYVYRKKGFE
jgi:ABC-2 type transport system permease protein